MHASLVVVRFLEVKPLEPFAPGVLLEHALDLGPQLVVDERHAHSKEERKREHADIAGYA